MSNSVDKAIDQGAYYCAKKMKDLVFSLVKSVVLGFLSKTGVSERVKWPNIKHLHYK